MNDEEKWNSGNAPQNDRDTGRFNEPPRYEHYNMHQTYVNETGQESEKKKRRKKSGGRKLASTISLAVVFGLVAGVVFQGVNFFAAQYMGTTTADAKPQIETAQLAVSASSDDAASEGTDSSENGTADAEQSVSAQTGSVSDVAKAAMPTVVAITSVSIQEIPNYFRAFGFGYGDTQQYSSEGSGSGIIVGENDDELLIATNNHVVDGATTLSVCFAGNDVVNAEAETVNMSSESDSDGDVNVEDAVSAKIKGTDETNDLAVVAVQKSDIPEDTLSQIKIAQLGDSDSVEVGEQVVAIGNALGYGQSVTSGWISALNRSISTSDGTTSDGLIQTDAAINPGNSGGALLNMQGEVVGINSAKYADSAVEGMGYAIAISDVTDTLEQLMNETPRDKVDNHGVLGITGMSVSDEASQYYGVPEGVLVSEVTDGGAADKAGIKEKSIITEFDGKRVRSIDELVSRLEYYEPGEEVEVTLEVADGDSYKEKKVTVTLGENPDADSSDSKDASSKDDAQAEDSQDDSQDQEDQSTDSLLQDFENQQADGTAYEQFFGFLN